MHQLLRSIDYCLLTVKVYNRDVKVHLSALKPPPFVPEPELDKRIRRRSKIIQFSKRSTKRLRFTVRNSEDQWKVFITLTYPEQYPCNGKGTKAHLNAFLQYLRRKNIKYVWVLEFQERGAPHYHVIASDFIPKAELSERWYEIVGSRDEKHLRAGTQIAAIKSKGQLYGYLSNYIKKLDQKTPPAGFENVGRFWRTTRNLLVYEAYQRLGHYYRLVWSIKLLRNWYKAHLRQFGIKWKWRGQGFTALDGVSVVRHLVSLKC